MEWGFRPACYTFREVLSQEGGDRLHGSPSLSPSLPSPMTCGQGPRPQHWEPTKTHVTVSAPCCNSRSGWATSHVTTRSLAFGSTSLAGIHCGITRGFWGASKAQAEHVHRQEAGPRRSPGRDAAPALPHRRRRVLTARPPSGPSPPASPASVSPRAAAWCLGSRCRGRHT